MIKEILIENYNKIPAVKWWKRKNESDLTATKQKEAILKTKPDKIEAGYRTGDDEVIEITNKIIKPEEFEDYKILSIEKYLNSDINNDWFKKRYGYPYMANTDFYVENNYIYRYQYNLNTSNSHSTQLGTGEYYSTCSLTFDEKDEKNELPKGNELIVYKLNKPYRDFNIGRPIRNINKGNVIQEIIRYLVQFQQLNYFYNPKYELGKVYDDIAIRINYQKKLLYNMAELKESLLKKSVSIFEKSIYPYKNSNTTAREFIEALNLGNSFCYYAPKTEGYDRRPLLLKAKRKYDSAQIENLIEKCIDEMLEQRKFVCSVSVKELMKSTGINQIRRVIKERKKEIDEHNLTYHNSKTYAKYKRNLN